ncbi:MAG: hypothetical protein KatS3mg115_0366 [Candidatus Poribacteria bacterium]|nr:MAG: hypothetical protein KatS3mg115_0366 [Candidatus Poribacteria bacterium]
MMTRIGVFWKRWGAVALLILGAGTAPARAQLDLEDLENLPPSPEAIRAQKQRMTVMTGLTALDGDPYWRVDLRPEFTFGRLGLGLKAVLLIGQPSQEGEGGGTKLLTENGEEWDNPSAFLRSIRYVQWAQPRSPFYVRYGELFNVRIGHGLVMEGYSNYDRRGVRLNINRPGWGFETLVNNVQRPELFGGRVYVRPLRLAGSDLPLISKVTLGGLYLIDTNPLPDRTPNGEEGILDEDPLTAAAGDISLPLYESERALLEVYDELAVLSATRFLGGKETRRHYRGNAIGIGLEISNFRAKLEYRTLERGFIPTLFNYNYEFRARTPEGGGITYFDESGGPTAGVVGRASWNLMEQVFFDGLYEDYNGEGEAGKPSLGLRMVETTLLEPIDVQAYYLKRNIGAEEDFWKDLFRIKGENAFFLVRLIYRVTGPVVVIASREFRFKEAFDEEGNSLGYHTISKTTVQLGADFYF